MAHWLHDLPLTVQEFVHLWLGGFCCVHVDVLIIILIWLSIALISLSLLGWGWAWKGDGGSQAAVLSKTHSLVSNMV